MSYMEEQNRANFKVGEKVKVTRKIIYNHEGGWENIWPSEMDSTIGKIYIIKIIGTKASEGISLGNYSDTLWWYPFFVLSKINQDKPLKKVKIIIDKEELEVSEIISNIMKKDL